MITDWLTIVSSWLTHFISVTGYPGIIFLMAIESAGIPAPSEIIMPFSGFLVHAGALQFWLTVGAGTVGNLIGSAVAYWIGKVGGRPFLTRYGKYFFISGHDLDLADNFFAKHGSLTVFVGRLMPIVRTYISFPAGIAQMNFRKFCLYTSLGAFIWSLALTEFGVRLGQHWNTIKNYTHGLDLLVGIGIVVGIVLIVKKRSGKVS